MAHIIFQGININRIANEIQVKRDVEHYTSSYVGQTGSDTKFVSDNGRTISFKSICTRDEKSWHGLGHRLRDYKQVAYRYSKKAGVLTSPSKSKINGNYICTGFDYTEDTRGNYVIEWEFKEVTKFNVTKKTFRVWGKATSSANKQKKTAKNPLNSNLKYLLKNCGAMKEGNNGKCVKSLQKFLQSKGYYKNSKIDGYFYTNTKKAVKQLQKQCKLKATGEWDIKTRSYFQKKYKYPREITLISTKNAVVVL